MRRLSELSREELYKLAHRCQDIEKYVQEVRPIVEDVRQRGDRAVIEYTEKFDNVRLSKILWKVSEFRDLIEQVSYNVAQCLDEIIRKVRAVNEMLLPRTRVRVEKSEISEFKIVPIDRVGIYVPRGYVSTLIMLTTIAKIAGCPEVLVITPPLGQDRLIQPEFVYVLHRLQVGEVLVGNAVAALAAAAFGTESVKPVYKLFGPGNMYVQATKYILSQFVSIDGIEGPTELVVYIGQVDSQDVDKIVYDVLAELEHGTTSLAVVLSRDENVLKLVESKYEELKESRKLGQLITLQVDSVEQVIEFVNLIAPEHFEVYDKSSDLKKIVRGVRNVGVVAVNTPCTYLDYSAGICHVLPTSGFARSRGVITPLDFVKIVPVHEGMQEEHVRAGVKLAEIENMELHKRSLESRLS